MDWLTAILMFAAMPLGIFGPSSIAYTEARWSGLGRLWSAFAAVAALALVVLSASALFGPSLFGVCAFAFIGWGLTRGRALRAALRERARSESARRTIAAAWNEVERKSKDCPDR